MEWYETQMRTDPLTLMNPPTKMKPPNLLPEPVAAGFSKVLEPVLSFVGRWRFWNTRRWYLAQR